MTGSSQNGGEPGNGSEPEGRCTGSWRWFQRMAPARRKRPLHVRVTESDGGHAHQFRGGSVDVDRVSQWPAEPVQLDLHHVALGQLDPEAETKSIRAEEMDVGIARPPVGRVFKVMMFEVGDAMGHILFAGGERLRPGDRPIAQYPDGATRFVKIATDNQL